MRIFGCWVETQVLGAIEIYIKLVRKTRKNCNVFTAIEVSIELRHGQVCEMMVQEKERMQRHQRCEIRHFTVKPIPTPLAYSSSLFRLFVSLPLRHSPG